MRVIMYLSVCLLTVNIYGCSLHSEQKIEGDNSKISNGVIVCKNKFASTK